jgi:hypothetical protein
VAEGPALTGNWWGVRDDLAAHGVRLDFGFTQFYQGPVAGEGGHEWKYGGKPEVILDVDFGKLGLWQGFEAVVHREYNYGRTPAGAGGTILPPSSHHAHPPPTQRSHAPVAPRGRTHRRAAPCQLMTACRSINGSQEVGYPRRILRRYGGGSVGGGAISASSAFFHPS